MDLTEFLLARIAEDEEVARRAQRHYQHVFGIPHYFTANGDTSVAMNPRVALAECEAKRRIVERWRWADEHHDWSGDMEVPWDAAMDTLRDLAAVYAGHPDYREGEWRP